MKPIPAVRRRWKLDQRFKASRVTMMSVSHPRPWI